jgi:integrase
MNDPKKVQRGSLRQVARANGKWAWQWRYVDPATGLDGSKYFSGQEFPTEQDIERHLGPFRLRLNSGQTEKTIVDPTFGDLLDAYIAEENLIEIKSRRPGDQSAGKDELAFSTATSYLSLSNSLRVRWGTFKLGQFKPLGFQNWLKSLEVKPKTKGHLKAFVHRLFNKAKLYGMLEFHENPIALVEVRGISKRSRRPADLTIDEFFLILRLVPESYQDMILVDQCTGLRAGELLALRWEAVNFERLCMKVKEGVVNGRIGPVKTEYSEDELPLDPDFATILLEIKRKSNGSGLLFPSPATGRSYHASPIQQDYIRRAGWCLVACPGCGAAPGTACTEVDQKRGKRHAIPVHDERRQLATENGFGSVGWHTFRHTYRTLLSGADTPIDVQQKLLRHAQISTTQQYGGPPMENQRRANSKVVRKLLFRESAG